MTSTITIIIPSYNKRKYILECINSVLKQTFNDWKLIIIDDCSNDGTENLLKQFLNNTKIEIFFLKKNKGPSFCRNLGMRLSNSKFIAFLDADDFWEHTKLETQIKYMEENNINFSYTDYFIFKEKKFKKKMTNIVSELKFSTFIKNSSINTSTMVIKKQIIENIKFKKLELLEDYIFKCDLLKRGNEAIKVNICSTAYRLSNNNRSSDKFKNLLALWKVNKRHNKLDFISNILSIIMISFNSFRKYGFLK